MNNKGFTLVELLVTLVISAVISAAIFLMYKSQVQTQATQLAVAEMQQQARAAMMMLEDEIRTAGTDATGNARAGFVAINQTDVHFTRDITGGLGMDGTGDNIDNDRDGQTDEIDEWYNGEIDLPSPGAPDFYDPQEDISYFMEAGAGPRSLLRQTDLSSTAPASTPQRVADNVEVLDFVYLQEDGTVTASANNVRAVQVTLIVTSDNPVLLRKQRDTTNYQNLQGTQILAAPNDFRRRIILSSEIRVRNSGLDA